jgi:hypothetical protein
MTGTLLSPRLSAATAYFGTGLSLLGALTLVSQLSGNSQVHQMFVDFYTEYAVVQLDGINGVA